MPGKVACRNSVMGRCGVRGSAWGSICIAGTASRMFFPGPRSGTKQTLRKLRTAMRSMPEPGVKLVFGPGGADVRHGKPSLHRRSRPGRVTKPQEPGGLVARRSSAGLQDIPTTRSPVVVCVSAGLLGDAGVAGDVDQVWSGSPKERISVDRRFGSWCVVVL